jgi:putative hemolysin
MLQTRVTFPDSTDLRTDILDDHGLVARMLLTRQLSDVYRRIAQQDNGSFGTNVLAEMQISYKVSPTDLAHIPRSGPVVVVANHPFGILDGLILATILPSVRPDIKILTNYWLSTVPELQEFCLFVDPFGRAATRNRKPLKEALNWLNDGGMLVAFPAGEVSHFSIRNHRIEDPSWSHTASRLIRLTGAPALPVFFKGSNSISFYALGAIHHSLHTARLGHEFLKARGKVVFVNVGSTIPAATMDTLTVEQTTQYLRWRTYLLARRSPGAGRPGPHLLPRLRAFRAHKPLAAEVAPDSLASDVAKLRPESCLNSDREFSVFLAEAQDIPNVLPEIGRLRELTFRAVGEGTGKAADLDDFDAYYHHLFVWSRARQQIVGAYRIGDMRRILAHHGPGGLYTNTLFHYDPRLFGAVGDALELGRSFVRPEYQRQYAPLLLLWRAIGQFVVHHPEHAVLFGAVSISSRYNRLSRELLVNFYGSFLRSHLAGYVRPRRSFRIRCLRDWELQHFSGMLNTTDALGKAIADLEEDGKEIPILFKQYAKLGGEMLGFNVDPNFSNVVDGLILVDLRKTNRAILERYLGNEGANSFVAHHNRQFEETAHRSA